jgi:SAM-dependent methyltransferase
MKVQISLIQNSASQGCAPERLLQNLDLVRSSASIDIHAIEERAKTCTGSIRGEQILVSVDVGCGIVKRAEIGVDFRRSIGADIVADVQHLPFRDNVADYVYSGHVIEHLDYPFLLLSEINRILKPTGNAEIRYPRWKYMNMVRCMFRICFLNQLPFLSPPQLRDLLIRLGMRNKYAGHKYWVDPKHFNRYLTVKSVSFDSGVPVWTFLTYGGLGRYFGFLKRLKTDPMEIVVKATRRQHERMISGERELELAEPKVQPSTER